MTTFTKVNLHTVESAERIVRDALTVLENVDPPDDLREQTYTAALNLLAQVHLEQTAPAVLPSMMIPRGNSG